VADEIGRGGLGVGVGEGEGGGEVVGQSLAQAIDLQGRQQSPD
jgi:hypothetical protein